MILHGRAFVGGDLRDDVAVRLDGERIGEVTVGVAAPAGAVGVEGVLVPGFVDLHVHGGAGADFMDGDETATRRVCAFHAGYGTTTLGATTLSASRDAVGAALAAAAAVSAARHAGEARIGGVHLEGPYLNPAK